MYSTIKIYKQFPLDANKLMIIDDLEDFLATETPVYSYDKFQYIRQGLKISIKIPVAQTDLNISLAQINYCSIQNGTEKICYYYVMKPIQVSPNTIQLDLEMDTINTIKYGTDFQVTHKTLVNREHKDRFKKIAAHNRSYDLVVSGTTESIGGGQYGNTNVITNDDLIGMPAPTFVSHNLSINLLSWSFDSDTGTFTLTWRSGTTQVNYSGIVKFTFPIPDKYYRKIDMAEEGVTPVLYGVDLDVLDTDGIDWHLLYTGNTAVTAYAAPSGSVDVLTAGSKTINGTDLTAGVYYYILYDKRDNYAPVEITMNGQTGHTGRNASHLYMFVYYRSGTDVVVTQLKFANNYSGGYKDAIASGTKTAASFSISCVNDLIPITTSSSALANYIQILAATPATISITGFASHTLYDYTSIDRTDDEHIKLLLLPYKPFEERDGVVDSNWSYDSTSHFLQLNNLAAPLTSTIYTDVRSPMKNLEVDLSDIDITDDPNDEYESKLYHSDYWQLKFVYDSFSFVFALERVDIPSYAALYENKFTFIFSCTNTIQSRFLFTFPSYVITDKNLEDYGNILYINRNNEEILYNSAYMSYIKNGYNYDVKTKERDDLTRWVGVGLSAVGAVASFASSAYTGGFGIAGGITLTTTTMAQLVNATNTTAKSEAALNQKMLQLRQQKASVSNADAVDLMQQYTGNKAKLMLYRVSDRMWKTLWDLFFYTGYIDGTRHIPDVTSRLRFNFLSAELDIEEDSAKRIPADIMQDIKIKYSAGVTFIHHFNDEWDWEQLYENYEAYLFN